MNLLLVLSFGGSLHKWHEAGILSREIELYVEHLKRSHLRQIKIFSYDAKDHTYLSRIDCPEAIRAQFSLVIPRKELGGKLAYLMYSLNIPLLRQLQKCSDIVKTNQISGSWTALLLWLLGAPILARCGYLLSRRFWRDGKWAKAAISWILEWMLFNAAACVSVTTKSAARRVQAMRVKRNAVFVAPTYVNTDLFCPQVISPINEAAVFVGRLEPVKNVLALIDACHRLNIPLIVVGDGSLRSAVEKNIAVLSANVTLISRMQNTDIAALFQKHRLFVLPSIYEGLPKVLIEAMSAGMVCVGTNVPGINDLIEDGKNGYLAAGTTSEAIEAAILRAIRDPQRDHCARMARAYALANHSLGSYAAREFQELTKALSFFMPQARCRR